IHPLKNDPDKALCMVCNSTFGATHQGKRNVERHLSGSEHKRLTQMFKERKPLTSVFAADTLQNKVMNAEVLFTGFILEHNLPFEAAAHAAPLFREMFPDSAIAKKHGCAATKTVAIINYTMAPDMRNPVVSYMKEQPFSLTVDGSSDTGTESMYPLVLRIFDINRGEVCSKFWHMCLVSDSRAKGIFVQVSDAFKEYNIPWENVIGLSLDNASVNMRKHNGLTHFEKQNKSIYTAGCPCHIIHNTVSYAAKAFAEETRFNVDDFLIALFYYFDKSTKHHLKSTAAFVIKNTYDATRWLSREVCIDRALKQYPSLKSYFASQPEVKSYPRLCRLQQYFADLKTEVYLLFYHSILPLFSDVNKLLQLRRELTCFMHKLLGRFMQVTAYKEKPVTEVNMQDPSNFLSDQKLMIGFSTRMTIQKHNLFPTEEAAIVKGCRSFLVTACQYEFSHLPFTDVLLQHTEVLQFENKVADFDSLVYFVERFPTLKAKLDGKMDQLYDQWTAYKLLPDSIVENDRIDNIWSQLGSMKQQDGARKFDLLFEIVKHILVLPHSNAEEERIF
uniref:Uncharacterized protein n=1 Tax=Latimeria chalumnae TaxID=7897 RepID=H3B5F2_LATCH